MTLKLPASWKTAKAILIHKKGDNKHKNSVRISLFSFVQKLFTKVIVNYINDNLDSQQPREEAGFRKDTQQQITSKS